MEGWNCYSRGGRDYAVPSPGLLRIQRTLVDSWLKPRGGVHEAAHGYVEGRNVVSALMPHVGCRWLMHLDLRRFFPSCTEDMVQEALERIGLSPWENLVVRHNCMHRGVLPIGGAASPHLSNLCCWFLDRGLSCLNNYTRYSDQIILSGQAKPPEYEARVLCEFNGFKVNERKSWTGIRGRRRLEVMGWVIGVYSLTRSREYRRLLRAFHHYRRYQEE